MGSPPDMSKLTLIPWDPTSESHLKRMFDQRVSCGWRSNEVQDWAKKSIGGTWCLYWLVIPPSHPSASSLLQQHITRFPHESAPIQDTCTSAFGRPRQPSGQPIHPIGHIALSFAPVSELETLGLPTDEKTAYISKLYISWATQSSGFGGTSVRAVEALARDELEVKTVYLDAVTEEMQMTGDLWTKFYCVLGIPKPKVSNEQWYRKMGYEEFLRMEKGYFMTYPADKEGNVLKDWVPAVYFKKRLL